MADDDWKGEHLIRGQTNAEERRSVGGKAVVSASVRRRKTATTPKSKKARKPPVQKATPVSERLPDWEINDIMQRREAALARKECMK